MLVIVSESGMKILVACEFSGIVRNEFILRGHKAVSCDILDTEIPGPHYIGDVMDILYEEWDMIVAHPPCTYLALSGVQHLRNNEARQKNMISAVKFFNLFLDHPCQKVCVENPIMHGYAKQLLTTPQYSQKTQPFFHGHPERKATCLWLKGLPLLRASNNVSELMIGAHPRETNKIFWEPPGKNRQKNRSRTYPGIAKAMAQQWG